MNLELEGKRFVVGGGSSGLGRAIAEALVAEGARVVLLSRNPDEAAAALGERASGFPGDMADPAMPEALAEHVRTTLGGLDGLLVNHGGPPPGDALELTDDQWLAAFGLVLGGPIRLLRALVPLIGDGGAILWVTSSSVRQPIPKLDSSNVLRPGVAALIKCLSRELAPGIRVNGIMPGRLDTGRVRTLDEAAAGRAGRSPEEQRAAQEAAIPLGRYGDPAEFGRVGAFLLSPAASYVSGSSVQVDGALVSALP